MRQGDVISVKCVVVDVLDEHVTARAPDGSLLLVADCDVGEIDYDLARRGDTVVTEHGEGVVQFCNGRECWVKLTASFDIIVEVKNVTRTLASRPGV